MLTHRRRVAARRKSEFHFDLSVPLEVRFEVHDFDAVLERLGRQLGFKNECGGGGTGGEVYDYSMYVMAFSLEDATRFSKDLRSSALLWLKKNWDPGIRLSHMLLSKVTPSHF